MTPRNYQHACRECANYINERCILLPYEPCDFKKAKRPHPDRFFFIFCALIAVAFAALILFAGCNKNANETQTESAPEWSAVELLRKQNGELSNFDKLTLAIALTESRFNPEADSGAGDGGLLQLREIYIQEVNRLYGTAYTFEDSFDIDKSLEMFRLMQEAYNPSKDLDEAIRHHNKSSAYKAKVLQNYGLICRYEAVRTKLIEK